MTSEVKVMDFVFFGGICLSSEEPSSNEIEDLDTHILDSSTSPSDSDLENVVTKFVII